MGRLPIVVAAGVKQHRQRWEKAEASIHTNAFSPTKHPSVFAELLKRVVLWVSHGFYIAGLRPSRQVGVALVVLVPGVNGNQVVLGKA